MRSELGGLSLALRALLAQQQALETTGHNIANANTEGYSRQVVRMRPSHAVSLPGVSGQLGSGVEVVATERIRSSFFEGQIRQQSGGLGRWETVEDFLHQIELVFGEPSESGISGALGRFWNAWREVSSAPESISARRALVARAEDVATLINTASRNLTALRDDANRQVLQRVTDVNNLAEQIAVMNERIAKVLSIGDQPNDLRDERDRLMTALSKLVDFTSTENDRGMVTITAGTGTLVTGTTVSYLATTTNAENYRDVVWYNDGTAATFNEGELQGLLLVRDTDVANVLGDLNTMTEALADAVNTQHQAGYDLTGTAGVAFFTYTAGSAASTIAVNGTITLDVNTIAAADAVNIGPPVTPQPGNGKNALALANVQATQIGVLNGTIDEYFTGIMTELGADTQHATLARETQEVLVEHMRKQQASESGVNLDEEASRLIVYQRAYQGAARVMNAMDELLDLVINGMGRVGR